MTRRHCGESGGRGVIVACRVGELLADDLARQVDALVANRDVGCRAADERSDLAARLAAERASQGRERRSRGPGAIGRAHTGDAIARTVLSRAVSAVELVREPRWTPLISPAAYDRRGELSRDERRALDLIKGRPIGRRSPDVASALSRLIAPINDVLAVTGLKPGSGPACLRAGICWPRWGGRARRSGGGIAASGSEPWPCPTSMSASW